MFTALDMRTNTIVWQQHWANMCYSGATATAGGLVFVGRNDGRLTALDSENGKKLWEFQTGAGMNAPVSVFAHEGKQYVVAYFGRQLVRRLGEGRQRLAVRARRHDGSRRARQVVGSCRQNVSIGHRAAHVEASKRRGVGGPNTPLAALPRRE